MIYLVVCIDVDGFDEDGVSNVRNEVENLLQVVRDLMVHWKLSINDLNAKKNICKLKNI